MIYPPAKKARTEPTAPPDPLLLTNKDIWVKNILPFVGPGHFVFVAGVNHQFKELYEEYISTIKKPPMQFHWPRQYVRLMPRCSATCKSAGNASPARVWRGRASGIRCVHCDDPILVTPEFASNTATRSATLQTSLVYLPRVSHGVNVVAQGIARIRSRRGSCGRHSGVVAAGRQSPQTQP